MSIIDKGRIYFENVKIIFDNIYINNNFIVMELKGELGEIDTIKDFAEYELKEKGFVKEYAMILDTGEFLLVF